tara:strand:- start:308 stop:1132 length:825 start_codon:yes stop_codon:yes gene_type:complete
VKKILILGSKGELGKKIIKIFQKDKNLKIYTDKLLKNKSSKNYINLIINSSAQINIILNLVGYSGKSREKLRESNFRFTRMIVETLNSLKNKNIKLIHLSTVGVLDLQNNKENKYKANNYYEYTKIISEKLITSKNNNFNYLIIRAAALHDLQMSNFKKNLQNIFLFKKYLFVFNQDSRVYFTNVTDLVDLIRKMIKGSKKNKIFNISENVTVKNYLKKIKKQNIKIIIFNYLIYNTIKTFSSINSFLNFILDNKFFKYFWLFNSIKILKKNYE